MNLRICIDYMTIWSCVYTVQYTVRKKFRSIERAINMSHGSQKRKRKKGDKDQGKVEREREKKWNEARKRDQQRRECDNHFDYARIYLYEMLNVAVRSERASESEREELCDCKTSPKVVETNANERMNERVKANIKQMNKQTQKWTWVCVCARLPAVLACSPRSHITCVLCYFLSTWNSQSCTVHIRNMGKKGPQTIKAPKTDRQHSIQFSVFLFQFYVAFST